MRRSPWFAKILAVVWLCAFPGAGSGMVCAQNLILSTSDASSDAVDVLETADLPSAVFAEPDSVDTEKPEGFHIELPGSFVAELPNQATVAAMPASEFRVISTRNGAPQWQVRGDDGQFRRTNESTFRETTDTTLPLVVFVHGNQTSHNRAIGMGCELYRLLCSEKISFRLVVWSWNSDCESLAVRIDSRLKADRADAQAVPLASFIASQPAESPVILVGYSFGCRTIGGAAQLCAGGKWLGKRLAFASAGLESTANTRVLRSIDAAIFIAAAMDDTNFQTGGGMDVAFDAIGRSLITVNPCDQALAFYPMISDQCRSATGFGGPNGVPAAQVSRVRLLDVSREAGPLHLWESYFSGSQLGCRIAAAVREATPVLAH